MTAGSPSGVSVFGDVFVDLVMSGFQKLPELGEEALASHFHRETGGGAVHTAHGLAVLGQHARLFAAIGAADADLFRNRLGSRGVDLAGLNISSTESTAITVAVSTPNDRVFYTYPGANRMLRELLMQLPVREGMAASRHIHFAHLMDPACMEEVCGWFRNRGCTISIDIGWDEPWLTSPVTLHALRLVDWFMPNEREAARVSGQSDPRQIVNWFRDNGLRGAVVKLGPQGAIAFSGRETVHVPAVPLQPVETTGAGDCFDAGFLFAWLNGKPLADSLAWGNICGGMSTRRPGGIDGFPTAEEVQNALQRYERTPRA